MNDADKGVKYSGRAWPMAREAKRNNLDAICDRPKIRVTLCVKHTRLSCSGPVRTLASQPSLTHPAILSSQTRI